MNNIDKYNLIIRGFIRKILNNRDIYIDSSITHLLYKYGICQYQFVLNYKCIHMAVFDVFFDELISFQYKENHIKYTNHCVLQFSYYLHLENNIIDRVHDLFNDRIVYQNLFGRKQFIQNKKYKYILNSQNGHLYYHYYHCYKNKKNKKEFNCNHYQYHKYHKYDDGISFEFILILHQEIMEMDNLYSTTMISGNNKKLIIINVYKNLEKHNKVNIVPITFIAAYKDIINGIQYSYNINKAMGYIESYKYKLSWDKYGDSMTHTNIDLMEYQIYQRQNQWFKHDTFKNTKISPIKALHILLEKKYYKNKDEINNLFDEISDGMNQFEMKKLANKYFTNIDIIEAIKTAKIVDKTSRNKKYRERDNATKQEKEIYAVMNQCIGRNNYLSETEQKDDNMQETPEVYIYNKDKQPMIIYGGKQYKISWFDSKNGYLCISTRYFKQLQQKALKYNKKKDGMGIYVFSLSCPIIPNINMIEKIGAIPMSMEMLKTFLKFGACNKIKIDFIGSVILNINKNIYHETKIKRDLRKPAHPKRRVIKPSLNKKDDGTDINNRISKIQQKRMKYNFCEKSRGSARNIKYNKHRRYCTNQLSNI